MASGAWKGLLVALLNVAVVACCLAFAAGHPDMVPPIVMIAGLPAAGTGLVVGAVLSGMQQQHVVLRVLAALLPAVLLVALLGTMFGFPQFILGATLPTAAACMLVERWTRKADELPTARSVV